jgi:hypothetical protein
MSARSHSKFILPVRQIYLYWSASSRTEDMSTIESAVNYPREGEEAWKTVAIGAVLSLLSFLLVPAVLVAGYLLRVLRASLNDEPVPVFEEWGDMLVEGAKTVAVIIVYTIIPGVILTVSGVALAGAALGDGAGSVVLALGALLGFLIGGALLLVLVYVLPVALSSLASTDRIGSAFAVGEMRPTLFSREYAVAWLLALLVSIVAGVVAGAVSLVPLGFVVALPVQFYATVVAFHLYGRGIAEQDDVDTESPESPKQAVRRVPT